MTTNIATTREQSARLLQCGVDPRTADMMFTPHNTLSAEPYKEGLKDRGYFPAWSLSALLPMLPSKIETDEDPYDEIQEYGLLLYPFKGGWQIDYQYCIYDECHNLMCIYSTDIIEICVRAIELLTANNYKLNEL